MSTVSQISLYYRDEHSDKEYHVQLEQVTPTDYLVNFQYGRRDASLTAGTKTSKPVSRDKAQAIYDKLVREKTAKGYSPGSEGARYQQTTYEERVSGLRPQLLNSIDEAEVESYLTSSKWWMQEKKDGRRVQILKRDGIVVGSNKLGLVIPLPEPVAVAVHELPEATLALDGEMIGSTYYCFDLMRNDRGDLSSSAYADRYTALSSVIPADRVGSIMLVQTAQTSKDKRIMLETLRHTNAEGVVFKDLAAHYVPGRPANGGTQLKYKFTATGSFIVHTINEKRSVGIGLLDANGRLIESGNVTIPIGLALQSDNIIEVRYLYAMLNSHKLFQPVFCGVRDDIRRDECRLTQLKYQPMAAQDRDDE